MSLLAVACLQFFGPPPIELTSPEPLISREASQPLSEIPRDALWIEQSWYDRNEEYEEDGEILRIYWDEKYANYAGIWGTDRYRVLPLGPSRILLETDADHYEKATNLSLLEWVGGAFVLYRLDGKKGSDLARHIERHGRSVGKPVAWGQQDKGWIFTDRDVLLGALRSYAFPKSAIRKRLHRPTHDEMTLIWSYLELMLWQDQSKSHLMDIEMAMDRLQTLGPLHTARRAASAIAYADLENVNDFALDPFQYGLLTSERLKKLGERGRRALEEIDAKLEARFQELESRVEILSHEPGENEYRRATSAGQVYRLEVEVKRADGQYIEDTRLTGMPWEVPLGGNVPEGIQYAMTRMRMQDVVRMRLPAALAFGPQHGDVEVELELLEHVPTPQLEPPLKDKLLHTDLVPMELVETPSKLRYRDMMLGDENEPLPVKGQKIKVRIGVWLASGTKIREPHETTVTLGESSNLDALDEALATMRPGGARILYVPPHLAYERPERAGSCLRITLEMLAIDS